MDIRKIAVLGSFAAGAALAFAPLASAAPTDPLISVLDSEIAAENSLFQFDALLAGDSNDITVATTPGVFDTIIPADIGVVQGTGATAGTTPFDFLVYGVDPTKAGLASDPGSYNDFNGALTEFDNAYNVELYSLLNGGALDTNVADYIQNSALDHALTLGSTTDAFDYLWNFGVGDLSGFFQVPLTFLDLPV